MISPRTYTKGLLGALILASTLGVQAATVYKCVDSEGQIAFSDSPCEGGDKIEISSGVRAPVEKGREKSLEDSRQYNKSVANRIEVKKLRREKSQLEGRRRVLIRERDSQVAKLAKVLEGVSSKDRNARAYWMNQIIGVRSVYGKRIGDLESEIFQKQAELQLLNERQETAQSRPSSRVLDRASWGKCSLYVEGDETAMSLRVRGEGYEPGELVETISRSSDEIIRQQVKSSKEGKFDGLVLPRVSGKSGGKASYSVNGQKCRLTVNYRWRMP